LSCPLSVTSTLSMSSRNRKMSGDKSMGGNQQMHVSKCWGSGSWWGFQHASESHQETSPWEESCQSCQSV
jgi:hypothetical protein